MEIITKNRDEYVYADMKISKLKYHGLTGPHEVLEWDRRGEFAFLNMHNMTEKEIRKEIHSRFAHHPVEGCIDGKKQKIRILSIYLKDEE